MTPAFEGFVSSGSHLDVISCWMIFLLLFLVHVFCLFPLSEKGQAGIGGCIHVFYSMPSARKLLNVAI